MSFEVELNFARASAAAGLSLGGVRVGPSPPVDGSAYVAEKRRFSRFSIVQKKKNARGAECRCNLAFLRKNAAPYENKNEYFILGFPAEWDFQHLSQGGTWYV